ncbi:hypothetical protein WQE_25488 [Paraburkholderia hospita]|uniref:Uncharacterized protein n=1 Tax=Paraburkholderia hospita TaxID=169430 RepID=A0ABP2PK23_9BURK|nr:hypothetical protein [Paraburkholderia hospita]EIM98152.1 hypothetical protein WQE_25488 [Paraburkholderia hospita]OUL88007.1 hypothetical protein CA602_12345 [Paraburkholderia hospita]
MTTTPDFTGLKAEVVKAIHGVIQQFQPTEFHLEADGAGGARIRFGPVGLGDAYAQKETWVGAHIPPLVPYSDVYPVFVRGDLLRADEKALVVPMTQNHTFMGQPAVQVSLRSNRREATRETACMKLLKVIHWVINQ